VSVDLERELAFLCEHMEENHEKIKEMVQSKSDLSKCALKISKILNRLSEIEKSESSSETGIVITSVDNGRRDSDPRRRSKSLGVSSTSPRPSPLNMKRLQNSVGQRKTRGMLGGKSPHRERKDRKKSKKQTP